MPLDKRRRRITDRFQLIPTWERVSRSKEFAPSLKPAASSDKSESAGEYERLFAALVETGAWLQRAVAERRAEADALARELSAYADLASHHYEESQPERIAAAYFLWPYHAASYYGYTPGLDAARRLESREALCSIQGLLYNNVRGLLDVMRLWFDSFSDEDSGKYVCDPKWASSPGGRGTQRPACDGALRRMWRPAALIDHAPDLCAVDFLAEHALQLTQARPLIRKAVENIQKLSLLEAEEKAGEKAEESRDLPGAVIEAFRKLRVAQMTVFYHPKPFEVYEDDVPLFELVHRTLDSASGRPDAIPEKLIPFEDSQNEDDQKIARNFRRLASAIYSVQDRDRYPKFSDHRSATIERLAAADATNFISDGSISHHFLSTEPPVSALGGGNGDEAQDAWPLWYSQKLSEFNFETPPPDWGDSFWWRRINPEELRRQLFPGADGIHENHHMSSLWDELAAKGEFVERIDIPNEAPRGEPSFGYLMELLLRREEETRTSFFFALAQTFNPGKPRLCQFVGGTLLGLERAGIPFSHERFKAIASRMRGLVMAVAHYTTTYAVKFERLLGQQQRKSFDARVALLKELLKGEAGGYNRDGYLLFAVPLPGGGTDHGIAPVPSRSQIRAVFTSAGHLRRQTSASANCWNTWKALFYLGSADKRYNTLEKFKAGLRDLRESVRFTPEMADRAVACEGCFRAALKFLLDDVYNALDENKKIGVEVPIKLPSRPGIRFLIALCRFISDVHSESVLSDNTSITGLKFSGSQVVIDFDKPKLLEAIWERKDDALPDTEKTTGTFKLLETALVERPPVRKGDPWSTFLGDKRFATPPTFERENDSQRLVIRW